MRRAAQLAAFVIATLLIGCDRSPAAPAAETGAGFDPLAFFAGHTHSWGVIEARSGAPAEWIMTDSNGLIGASNKLRMVQHLTFQDGTTQQRDWTLWRSAPGHFIATASDMVGSTEGEVAGAAFHWQWELARAPGNRLMNVTMNQWMYRLHDGSVLIRTTVSKLGFIFAEVTEQFTRVDNG